MEYKVIWQSHLYGISFVEANSPEEAKVKALANEDTNFDHLDPNSDWEIESIEKIEDSS